MLAVASEPFDSEDWIFEIKWDGVRALAFHDVDGGVWIRNRRGTRIEERYPDLAQAIEKLPRGSVLDGEIIVAGDDGMPEFSRVLEREQGQGGARLQTLMRERPACFVAFDQLYADGASLLSFSFLLAPACFRLLFDNDDEGTDSDGGASKVPGCAPDYQPDL